MSKTQILCHTVFCTKNRQKTITPQYKKDLYAFLYGVFRKNKCWVHRINGIENHIHLLFDLAPTISLAALMKELKQGSSIWLSHNVNFPHFNGWGKGYFAVSVSPGENLEKIRNYIINQEVHHKDDDFIYEIENLIHHNNMQWYSDDWV